jgi:hypothetical protein
MMVYDELFYALWEINMLGSFSMYWLVSAHPYLLANYMETGQSRKLRSS